jgi:hypothetical protein
LNTIVDKVLRHDYAKKAREKLEYGIEREVRSKGLIYSSKEVARVSMINTVKIAIITIPLAIVAGAIINPLMFMLLFIPLIAYYYPLLAFKTNISIRAIK